MVWTLQKAQPHLHRARKLAQSHQPRQYSQNYSVKLAEVDLEESKELQSQLRIGSFPTLLFYKNAVSSKFGGDRSKQVMSEWLKKKILDPIIATNVDNLANIETDGKVNIVFFGDVDSTQGKILLNLAKVDDYNSKNALIQCTIASPPLIELLAPLRCTDLSGRQLKSIRLITASRHGSISTTDLLFISLMIELDQSFSVKREMVLFYSPLKDKQEHELFLYSNKQLRIGKFSRRRS